MARSDAVRQSAGLYRRTERMGSGSTPGTAVSPISNRPHDSTRRETGASLTYRQARLASGAGCAEVLRKRKNIAMHPSNGTTIPALSVPNRSEERPTIHGSNPPLMLERVNITDPMFTDPNCLDRSEMVIG